MNSCTAYEDFRVALLRHLGIPPSTLTFKMDRLDVRELARRIRGNEGDPARAGTARVEQSNEE